MIKSKYQLCLIKDQINVQFFKDHFEIIINELSNYECNANFSNLDLNLLAIGSF